MQITKREENGEIVLAVSGCLDTMAAPQFATELNQYAAESPAFVLDFKELEFIASSALRTLVSLQKQLKAKGGGITMANLNDIVSEVFEVTGLNEVFAIR